MKTTKKHAIWFHACILYSIWYMCVGGACINIFSGGPQSSSYGPDGAYFSALILKDQSVNTARGCGPLVRSRSGASVAVQRSFPHRVYLCCTARTELKWQRIVCGRYEHGLTRKYSNYTINANNWSLLCFRVITCGFLARFKGKDHF